MSRSVPSAIGNAQDLADAAHLAATENDPLIRSSDDGSIDEAKPNHDNRSITLPRALLCALALGLLIFLQATNISVLSVIQSDIVRDLDAFERSTWMTSAYLIAMSSLAPLSGKLCTIFSPRVCIFISSIILAAGACISGAATTFAVFILGRVLTGIGASGVFTVSMIIVLDISGPKRRGLAMGILNSGFTLGVAVGATAAGAVLPHIKWRGIFYVQAPIALLGGTTLFFSIPATFRSKNHPNNTTSTPTSIFHRLSTLDYPGALLLTLAITLLLYSLSSPTHIPLIPLLLSPLTLLLFLYNETRLASDPIIPIPLLQSQGLLFTCLATTGFMMSRWTVLFYTPTYALAVRQWRPATAGSILIPTNLGFALGGLLVGWLHIRRAGSFWLPTVLVFASFPLTLLILAFLAIRDSPAWAVVLDVFFCGAATGAALNYSLAHLLHLTPEKTHYVATALLATFRGFAGSFGSSIGGGMFTRTLRRSLERGFAERGIPEQGKRALIRRLLGQQDLVRELEGIDREVAIQGYEDALRMLFLAAAGLAVLMVFVQAATGWKGAEKDVVDGEGVQETDDEDHE